MDVFDHKLINYNDKFYFRNDHICLCSSFVFDENEDDEDDNEHLNIIKLMRLWLLVECSFGRTDAGDFVLH